MQVFISYAKEDYKIAKRLYHDLKSRNLNPWMDRKNLLIGQKWKVEIPKAIRKSSHFLALLSSQSVSKKGFVQKELKIAMDVVEDMPDSEIFILPLLLDDQCGLPEGKLADIHCGELFPSYEAALAQVLRVFMPEMADQEESGNDAETIAGTEASDILLDSPAPKYRLRSKPITVSSEEFKKVFRLNEGRKPLEYISNDYEDNGDETVSDRATGLMWQKSGSDDRISCKNRQAYIRKLNQKKFAGYDDWRLPTIEELASLLENEKRNGYLYIGPVFDKRQRWCWSADEWDSGSAWLVYFDLGDVIWNILDDLYYVRAVRS